MNVSPTNSGTIVQARAQVLMGSLLPAAPCFCTFSNRRGSTNGPFLLERLMGSDWGLVVWCLVFVAEFARIQTLGENIRNSGEFRYTATWATSTDHNGATFCGGQSPSWKPCGGCGCGPPW